MKVMTVACLWNAMAGAHVHPSDRAMALSAARPYTTLPEGGVCQGDVGHGAHAEGATCHRLQRWAGRGHGSR